MSDIAEESPVEQTLTIARLGARGDGLTEGGLAVPGALPGERVRVRVRRGDRVGTLVAVEEASPERIAPFCPYFSACGGCAVQHLAPGPYAAWKRGIVASALAQARIETDLRPLLDARGAGRRRITLHVREIEGRAEAGLMAARSHALVAIDHCPITVPALHRAPAVAQALAAPLGHGRKPLDVAATATVTGLDIDIRGHGTVSEGVRGVLTRLAGELDLARLSIHGDVVVERRPPAVGEGPTRRVPPPGGFLQATQAGEAALTALVLEAMDEGKAKVRRVDDLFCGSGPFALALAAGGREVHAVEGEAAAITSLTRAYRAGAGFARITAEARDLFRRPLLGPELDALDAVVFDPPRAGAEAQARRIAESKVPLVVGVACDPGTFARDAATLIAGGYQLERVTPVDQFAWSAHVELVGVFRKAARKPAGRTLRRPR
ncbi:class I SAM-dependent RNA methyltransferase [Methylorubrum rhodesianum]|uniref:class I SAM-dependent RNA methyltransferase n=1 Tax=Methylorubrum TaxID=2282523 RepID=UPI0016191C56|nr:MULTISPECIES: class I SAM-dependent RNA methyltransferase [Methylorubrum]MBB5765535.1 23S rRNA (uracil1939-C5)-methyltransferase [Methylorubrum rhodesianum]MBI1691670.1 class I SAM-dependent RNA methyltransferase [Methylorubrum sp. DB1722]